jgi:hypothetical protein
LGGTGGVESRATWDGAAIGEQIAGDMAQHQVIGLHDFYLEKQSGQ